MASHVVSCGEVLTAKRMPLSFMITSTWAGTSPLRAVTAPQWLKIVLLGAGLPEGPYRALAEQLGLPASWPIVLADHDRLVVTCNKRDDTVHVLWPPGEDPRKVLRAARLVLPEGSYGELAGQLGVPPSWPME
jgi:hypothetical protein